MKYTTLLILLFLPLVVRAQNWKTVSNKDTVYFAAGRHTTGYTNPPDSALVKAIWVTSSQKVNGDSLFHFFTCARSIDLFYSCIDTLAPSWLGPSLLRKASGIEYYFNSIGDTITIKTKAALGDTWVLARDSNGIEYRGTVTNVGLATVDSIPDSAKTIGIQAYQNNVPISAWYNTQVLQWSKDHGWLKALDLYRFPNRGNNWEGYGALIDSGGHDRLPTRFENSDTSRKDFAWKYQPGNVWIERTRSHPNPTTTNYVDEFITKDSVVSSTVSADTAIVMFKTEKYSRTWHFHMGPPYNYWYDSISTTSYFHQETMINTQPVLVRNVIFPELTEGVLTPNSYTRYFTDTFCDNKYLVKVHQPDDQIIDHQSCWQLVPNVSSFTNIDHTYLPGFGLIYSQYRLRTDAWEFWVESTHIYLKIGDCVWGNDVNVLALGVENMHKTAAAKIYPNPAREKVTILTSSASTDIILYDVMGRPLQQVRNATNLTELPLTGCVPGVYILSVRTKDAVVTYKLQVE